MIRVLIVEDQDLVRAGISAIVSHQDDLEVVAEASDGFAALELIQSTRPDVVLMDIQMPGIDGVEVTRRLHETMQEGCPRILVLTTFERDENVINALRAGADGFLGKGAAPGEIVDAIRVVSQGSPAMSVAAMHSVIGHVAQDRGSPGDPDMFERFATLTTRERQIVEALVRGNNGDTIALQFFLSPFTVKTHVNRAMAKVGARDRAQLVSFAVRAGILP